MPVSRTSQQSSHKKTDTLMTGFSVKVSAYFLLIHFTPQLNYRTYAVSTEYFYQLEEFHIHPDAEYQLTAAMTLL